MALAQEQRLRPRFTSLLLTEPAGHVLAGALGLALACAPAMGLTEHEPTIEYLVDLIAEAQTVRDTLAWFDGLPAERRAAPLAGLTPEREKAVLAAWHARNRSQ